MQCTAHKGYQCHRSHSLYVIRDVSSEYLSVLKFPYQPPIQKLPPSPPVTLKFPAESIMGNWNLKRFRERHFSEGRRYCQKNGTLKRTSNSLYIIIACIATKVSLSGFICPPADKNNFMNY